MDISIVIDGVWNEWFLEKLTINPKTGLLKYSINNYELIEYNVGAFPKECMIRLKFENWGWYTGHYHFFDDLRIEQE